MTLNGAGPLYPVPKSKIPVSPRPPRFRERQHHPRITALRMHRSQSVTVVVGSSNVYSDTHIPAGFEPRRLLRETVQQVMLYWQLPFIYRPTSCIPHVSHDIVTVMQRERYALPYCSLGVHISRLDGGTYLYGVIWT